MQRAAVIADAPSGFWVLQGSTAEAVLLFLALLLLAALAFLVGWLFARRPGEHASPPKTSQERAGVAPGSATTANDAAPADPVQAPQGVTAPQTAAAPPPPANPAPALGPALDSQEQFSASLSHDLRAPLRVVEGFARLLKEDHTAQLDRMGQEHLDRILGAAARMNQMMDALLALGRLSSRPLQHQPVALSQMAGFIVEDLRRQDPARTAEVQIEPGLQAMGDPTLLRNVLENLLSNAWKYSARREQAEIGFSRVSLPDGRSAFCVQDNGAGFDMRHVDRLFGTFQRLHSASEFQGHGMGLATVRRIIERHGGQVWAEAAPDAGARFYFQLPG